MASRALKLDPRKTGTANREKSERPVQVTENEIAVRAYELWQERGCPTGSDQEDWFKAEAELSGQKARSAEVE